MQNLDTDQRCNEVKRVKSIFTFIPANCGNHSHFT